MPGDPADPHPHVARAREASPSRNTSRRLAAIACTFVVLLLRPVDLAAQQFAPSLPDTPHTYDDVRRELLPRGAADPRAGGAAEARRHDHLVTLGRVLFYDGRLSGNGRRSCGSCHRQQHGFGDRRAKSVGGRGRPTRRNTSVLVNLVYHPGPFFWDGRAATLEEAVLMPIEDPVEMGADVDEVVARLAGEPGYGGLFASAFGTPRVDRQRLATALAAFVRAIVSHRSRYDGGLAAAEGDVDREFDRFRAAENRGKALYFGSRGGCFRCHNRHDEMVSCRAWSFSRSVFVADVTSNNGLGNGGGDEDPGHGAVTGRRFDIGRFRTPSLRNLAYSGPYMHDGSIGTLDDVLGFYAHRVRPHPNLAGVLRADGMAGGYCTPRSPAETAPAVGPLVEARGALRLVSSTGLRLSRRDRDDLVAFLHTLCDQALLSDPRFSDPFAR